MKTLLLIGMLTAGVLFFRLHLSRPGDDLQGRWTIVSAPEGWKLVPGTDVMVTSDEIQLRIGTVVTTKMHYTADSDEGTIDATIGGGKARLGVYRLDGEQLTLSVGPEGGPRPASPDVKDGGVMRWVLRRGAHL
jgi:hypothetical protein